MAPYAPHLARSSLPPAATTPFSSSLSPPPTAPIMPLFSGRHTFDTAIRRLAQARRFSDIEPLLEPLKKDPRWHSRPRPMHPRRDPLPRSSPLQIIEERCWMSCRSASSSAAAEESGATLHRIFLSRRGTDFNKRQSDGGHADARMEFVGFERRGSRLKKKVSCFEDGKTW